MTTRPPPKEDEDFRFFPKPSQHSYFVKIGVQTIAALLFRHEQHFLASIVFLNTIKNNFRIFKSALDQGLARYILCWFRIFTAGLGG